MRLSWIVWVGLRPVTVVLTRDIEEGATTIEAEVGEMLATAQEGGSH